MENRHQKIKERISSKLSETPEKDIRFFRIAEFERMIERTVNLSDECCECRNLIPEIESITEQIDIAVNTPGKLRRVYDQLIDRMAKHQQKEHGFYPPYHYTYRYSFLGMLTGTLLGAAISYVFIPELLLYFILSGFMLGLLPAQFLGGRKDKQVRASGKIL